MEHHKAALMWKVNELLGADEFPGFLALHTDDAVMPVPANGPLSGDYRGREVFTSLWGLKASPGQGEPRRS